MASGGQKALSILYYSKHCKECDKLLMGLSKLPLQNEINFICIDQRFRDPATNKTFVILQNNSRVLLPDNITHVPAMLLLDQGYKTLYGSDIGEYIGRKMQAYNQAATQNNMEPIGFHMGSGLGSGGVISDKFTDLTSSPGLGVPSTEDMRSYVNNVTIPPGMNMPGSITGMTLELGSVGGMPQETTLRGSQKMPESQTNTFGSAMNEQLVSAREQDLQNIFKSQARAGW